MKFARMLPFALAIIMMISAPLVAQQAPAPFKDEAKIPDTPACKRALEVVDLINKGDHEKVRAYILENFTPEFRDMAPMEEHLQVFDGIRVSVGVNSP